MSLANVCIVLVRPQVAGNLGATARIMRNMGLSKLVLVEPVADRDDRAARQMSTHGEVILDRAHIVGDVDEAINDCGLVVGTSARVGGPVRRQSVGLPEEVMPHVVAAMRWGPVALLFGPEPSGLSNAEVTRCHYLIHIPTDPDYAALNLAQAVAICCYELRRTWLRSVDGATTLPSAAPFVEQERMFEQLRIALEEIHFLFGDKAEVLMHGLRHLLGRAQPSSMEVKLLLGLARQIRWYVKEHPPKE